ncbi:class I SAM-dependent methyltransferase [Pontibacter sp. KCTC 32443]|uniref:class I SAM-dependent methyltransferase n=1 Tax=Pontibacter TaxID=323449 RepID=UPI00164DA6F0|nr:MULTISPECIES: class I SAM-dependent methyltransferase [Pontibacter]MBC5773751.1 class I SAM-dependent methyltransferase [Pontibacter sp. KCTC 32443]
MDPAETGKMYDKIAKWWHDYHLNSDYGLAQIKRAISYSSNRGSALDVGCGSGGRVIKELVSAGFKVTGIDVSEKMIELARANHPDVDFLVQDISTWQTDQKHDLIVAWDSIFHLPLQMHAPVLAKLCNMLTQNGILIYTFGDDASGEHLSNWHNDQFYYSTIGIDGNLKAIMESNCQCRHLELDQFPQNHTYIIVQKK